MHFQRITQTVRGESCYWFETPPPPKKKGLGLSLFRQSANVCGSDPQGLEQHIFKKHEVNDAVSSSN